ncbi:hypothetical protein POTOM_019795 [Populus tomentosa]|uniref:Uncharacterized protein n=1 Tax=Populus tomentosa TaxID=118781 RepID=A0A8X8D2X6_POPTO|nr:hypothetical protein POTOM_019795 [Populus tomentosa]
MQLLQKLVSFTTCAYLVILILLPFVNSTQEQLKTTGTRANNEKIMDKLSPKLLFEITLHGFLLWASMGFLMPVGILAIRMSHREACGRRLKILFYVHSISQAGSFSFSFLQLCILFSADAFCTSLHSRSSNVYKKLQQLIRQPPSTNRRRPIWYSMVTSPHRASTTAAVSCQNSLYFDIEI